MGYTTRFNGHFTFDKPLTVPQFNELKAFADEHHNGRSTPGYYCQWVPTDDGLGLQWDGREKFYDYEAWLRYLIERFFTPWGIALSGSVTWQGEDVVDRGALTIMGNTVLAEKYERDPAIPICDVCGLSYDVREPHAH